MLKAAINLALAAIVVFVGLEPASAAACVPVPAPIVGAGLPIVLAVGGVYWAVKAIRNRRNR